MTIRELQIDVDKWIKEYGVRYFNELTNLGILVEEVGELSRYMVRIFGEQSFKKDADESSAKNNLQDELGDILFVLTCIANQCDIDMEKVIKENLQKKSHRDKDRHLNNPKL